MEMVQEGTEFEKLITNLGLEEPWKYCEEPWQDGCEPQLEALINATHVWTQYTYAPNTVNPNRFSKVMGLVPYQCLTTGWNTCVR